MQNESFYESLPGMGGRYSSPSGDRAPDPNSKRTIAAASVIAAVDLYESMEAATRRVLGSTGSATARLVSHKCAPLSIPPFLLVCFVLCSALSCFLCIGYYSVLF